MASTIQVSLYCTRSCDHFPKVGPHPTLDLDRALAFHWAMKQIIALTTLVSFALDIPHRTERGWRESPTRGGAVLRGGGRRITLGP